MATKKTAVIPEEEILAAATEENINEHALHQTETEPEPDRVLSAEGAPGDADLIDICQTDSESANPEGMPIEDAARNTPEAPVSQTGSGTELPGEFPAGSDELTAPEAPVSQTDSDLEEKKPEESPPARRTRKPRAKKSESDTTAAEPPGDASDGVESPEKKPRRRAAARPASPVVSIDERPSVETEADKARNDLLDLVESLKTKRILTGTIQGIERPADHPSRSLAVIYHGDIKSGRLFLCKLQEVIMKKMKTGIGVMLALLCCILMCTGFVYATGDDTDGTELQVAQPVILEVQLGPQWAGVEFQLKTDAGLYPGTIAVGQDGILRTELGNSGSYVLSCLTLNAAVPAPGDIPSPDVTQQEQEPLTTGSTENADAASQNVQEQDSGRPTVGGIPVMHIILFGGGLLLAAGSLVAMRFIRNRRPSERSPYDPDDEDDDEDEYEY